MANKEFNFNQLINLPDFEWVKKSITDIGDKNSEWKADFVEFVNSDSSDQASSFFYDMLPFMRFINEPNSVGAYTSPDHRIWMNAPHGFGIGQQDYKWEFIYYHECMHQLWDTFDVQKNIEKQFGSCDQMVLNIASDCVINDFLHINKKMPYPVDGLVTPESIKKDYGVEYDRSKDTQFSLYEKLLKVVEEIRKHMPPPQPNSEGQQGQGGGQSGQSGQGSQSGGQSAQGGNQGQQDPNSVNGMSGQDAADAADKAANEAQQAANGAQDPKSKKEAQKHADRAREHADKAKRAADAGDEATAKKEAKKAIEEANKAKQSSGQKNDGKAGGKGNYDADNGYGDNNEPTSDYFKKMGDKIIKSYAGKITGAFGEFVRKCKTSQTEEKHEGVVVKQRRGIAWNKALDKQMNAFIRQKVIAKRRETEQTYHRLKRGTRPVQLGQIIQPGIKIKEDKLNVTVAFYIDRSGSMDGHIDQVFSLAYQLSDKIRKNYKSEKVIGDFGFRYFAFDDQMQEIKKDQKVPARGGTMSLQSLLNYVEKETKNDLVNIIITDAQFNIDRTAVVNLTRSMPGMFFLIANEPKPECEEIEKQLKGQFVFLQANSQFEMDKSIGD